MIDDDSGNWIYAYDLNGNLVYQDDPQTGQHLELCYDQLNRITRKWYAGSDAQVMPVGSKCSGTISEPHFDYAYDCGSNRIGRLCSVQDALPLAVRFTGYTYDVRGRVASETITQDVTVSSMARSTSFARSFTYDLADRVATVGYPIDVGGQSELVSYT